MIFDHDFQEVIDDAQLYSLTSRLELVYLTEFLFLICPGLQSRIDRLQLLSGTKYKPILFAKINKRIKKERLLSGKREENTSKLDDDTVECLRYLSSDLWYSSAVLVFPISLLFLVPYSYSFFPILTYIARFTVFQQCISLRFCSFHIHRSSFLIKQNKAYFWWRNLQRSLTHISLIFIMKILFVIGGPNVHITSNRSSCFE